MRILHTADWHLGARLIERDRLAEQHERLSAERERLGKELEAARVAETRARVQFLTEEVTREFQADIAAHAFDTKD